MIQLAVFGVDYLRILFKRMRFVEKPNLAIVLWHARLEYERAPSDHFIKTKYLMDIRRGIISRLTKIGKPRRLP